MHTCPCGVLIPLLLFIINFFIRMFTKTNSLNRYMSSTTQTEYFNTWQMFTWSWEIFSLRRGRWRHLCGVVVARGPVQRLRYCLEEVGVRARLDNGGSASALLLFLRLSMAMATRTAIVVGAGAGVGIRGTEGGPRVGTCRCNMLCIRSLEVRIGFAVA